MRRASCAKPKLTGETKRHIRAYLAQRDGARCFYCSTPFGADLAGATLDHYIPHRLWPVNKPRNLRLACEPCNQAKADLLPWPVVWLLLTATATGTGTPAGTPAPAVPGHPIRSPDRSGGGEPIASGCQARRSALGRPTGSGAPSADRSADRLGWGVVA